MATTTPPRRARRLRNIPAKVAAKRLGYSVKHLLHLERTGQWPEHRIDEVAAYYGIRVNDLLPQPGCLAGTREARNPARRGIAPGRAGQETR